MDTFDMHFYRYRDVVHIKGDKYAGLPCIVEKFRDLSF